MEKVFSNYFSSNNWVSKNNDKAVAKKYKFKSFKEAFSWMLEVAITSEVLNHHPEWTNVYNKIDVILTTHNTGNISKKDLELAKIMDISFEKYRSEKKN